MRILIVALALAMTAAPAFAETIGPGEAHSRVGQTVTVEGAVGNVHSTRTGTTFIDIGGRYPDNPFTAVIFSDDSKKFTNVDALEGKTVDVTGPIRLHRGKPEIILKDTSQLKIK